MTVITDIPQSDIYFQQGAIVQIVAQINDYTTGEPVQLQNATGLSITMLYPDGVTSQTFAATLYTDGSDGRIVYTTRNTGSVIDLSQVGLYHFQGNAAVGGVSIPPSYQTDFYVLANVAGSSSPDPLFNSSALILLDSSSVRWGMTVDANGDLHTALTPSGPSTFLKFNNLVMQDSDGAFWTVGVSTLGVVAGTVTGQPVGALTSFVLNDDTGQSWVISISTEGVLQAS